MKHTIVHFEIPADDVERAKAFYTGLFGWEFSSPPGMEGYWSVSTGDEDDAGGGLMARQAPGQYIVNYIEVESVADHVAKAEGLGASVVMPKTPVPGMGWFAVLSDPEGNQFGVWQSDDSAA